MRKILLALILLPAALPAEEPEPADAADISADARDAALVKAVRYLDDELWKLVDGGSPRRQYSLAVAGWAYLLAADKGGKRLPARGRQIDRIHKELVRYVERVEKLYDKDDKARDKGREPRAPGGFEAMRTAQYSWTLGVAAHFFAECAARGKRRGDSKKALKAIARVLEASQQEDGGWGHDDASRPGMGLPPIRIPKPGGGQLDYPGTLLAASHCALSGLGLAHEALKIRRAESLEKGRAYFAGAQNGNGTFPYDPSQKHAAAGTSAMAGGIEVARSAGAVFALYCAGAPEDDPAATRGLAAIDEHPELMSEGHGSATMALQFGALLSRARGDRAWQTFRRIFFPRILGRQEDSGAFLCVCKHESGAVTCDTREIPGMPEAGAWAEQNKVYVTAIHTLVLCLDRTASRAVPKMPAPKGPVTPD